MNTMLIGAISTASLVISLFFLRYWKTTRDRFFLYFSLSFLLEAINRILLGVALLKSEESALYYLIRLTAYSLILYAIYDKNRRKG